MTVRNKIEIGGCIAGLAAIVLLIIAPIKYQVEHMNEINDDYVYSTLQVFVDMAYRNKAIFLEEYTELLDKLGMMYVNYSVELVVGNKGFSYGEDSVEDIYQFDYTNEIVDSLKEYGAYSLKDKQSLYIKVKGINNQEDIIYGAFIS